MPIIASRVNTLPPLSYEEFVTQFAVGLLLLGLLFVVRSLLSGRTEKADPLVVSLIVGDSDEADYVIDESIHSVYNASTGTLFLRKGLNEWSIRSLNGSKIPFVKCATTGVLATPLA